MFIKIIKSYRDIIAVCDSSILGKKFEHGNFQLDLKESFYKGEEFTEEKAIEVMKSMAAEDASFNIVGQKSVEAALKAKIIFPENVRKIQGIPFALVLL